MDTSGARITTSSPTRWTSTSRIFAATLEARGPRLIQTVRGRGYMLGDPPHSGSGGGTMSLVTRVSIAFLVALALALGGFSACLYYLAGLRLRLALDQELEATLDRFPDRPEGLERSRGLGNLRRNGAEGRKYAG